MQVEHRTNLPIHVAGGSDGPGKMSLAQMMANTLQADFGIRVAWQENQSRDTWENAANTATILKAASIRRVYLVTHIWHMRRALIAFRAAGLDPIPAPVREPQEGPLEPASFFPRTQAWYESWVAFHEWVGIAYYTFFR